MCGRYVTPDEAAMERAYNLTARQWQSWMDEAYRPSFNVAPTQRVPVLRVIRDVAGERRIEPLRWGLIPYWTNGEPPKYSTINAMIEKLDVAPAWRGPWRRSQRCVMPAAGFYEWQVQPDGTKQPYYIQPAGDGEVVLDLPRCGTDQGRSRATIRLCQSAFEKTILAAHRTSRWEPVEPP